MRPWDTKWTRWELWKRESQRAQAPVAPPQPAVAIRPPAEAPAARAA